MYRDAVQIWRVVGGGLHRPDPVGVMIERRVGLPRQRDRPTDDGVHPLLEQCIGLIDLADLEGLLGGDVEPLDQPDARDQKDRPAQQRFTQRNATPRAATSTHRTTYS